MSVYRQGCHSKRVRKNRGHESKMGFRGILAYWGWRVWDVWERQHKRKMTKERDRVGMTASEQARERPAFSCISFLDTCLLDDRIKEPFNVTFVLRFDINTTHAPLWARSLHTHNTQHVKQGSVKLVLFIQSGGSGSFWELTRKSALAVRGPVSLHRHVGMNYYTRRKFLFAQTWHPTIVSHNSSVRFCQKTHKVELRSLGGCRCWRTRAWKREAQCSSLHPAQGRR